MTKLLNTETTHEIVTAALVLLVTVALLLTPVLS